MRAKICLLTAVLGAVLLSAGCGGKSDSTGGVIRISIGQSNNPGEPFAEAADYWAEILEEESGGTMVMTHYPSDQLGSKTDLFDQMIAEKTVVKYDDAEALAKAYKMDPEALKKTIAQYNDDLAKQSDPKFGRRFDRSAKPIGSGPYFVSEMSPKVHHCMGGVKTDVACRVLDMDLQPIPGLFAAGAVAGGIHGACRLGSCATADCLVNGRIAGGMAAAE